MKKKLLSLVCALALTISLLPAAQALEGEGYAEPMLAAFSGAVAEFTERCFGGWK